MASKRRVVSESDSDTGLNDEPPDSRDNSKRLRVVGECHPCASRNFCSITSEPSYVVRRSSRAGKGTGGWMNQMQGLEEIQVAGRPRFKRLVDLDVATEDHEVNPMAPTNESQQSNSRPRPRPRLKSNHAGDAQQSTQIQPESSESSLGRPSFALAAPGQQFGFRLPNTDTLGSRQQSGKFSDASLATSSRSASLFGGIVSNASTAPTSRAASVCSSTGQHGEDSFSRRRSSHLQRLAAASQAGLEAPTRISKAVGGLCVCTVSSTEHTVQGGSRVEGSNHISRTSCILTVLCKCS